MLNLPPKMQAAFDSGSFEPVIYAELTTQVFDAPSAQQTQVPANVNNADQKAVVMNYPDSAGAVSSFIKVGQTNQIVGMTWGTAPVGRNNSRPMVGGYQTFTVGEDIGQSVQLKTVKVDISTNASFSGTGGASLRCRVYSVGVNGVLLTNSRKPMPGGVLSQGTESSSVYSVPNGATAKTTQSFPFSLTLVAGQRYAVLLYETPTGFNAATATSWVSWYGNYNKTMPRETAIRSENRVQGGAVFDGEFSLDLEMSEYDPAPTPVLQIQFDISGTPLDSGSWSIQDVNESIVDATTGLRQDTSITYNAWAGDTLGAKTINLGVVDKSDHQSLKVSTLKRFYVLEATFSATANGLRTPTFIAANITFPAVSAGVSKTTRFSSAALPDFLTETIPGIKKAPIVPTKLDPRNHLTKRGSATLSLIDLGEEVTRMAIEQNLFNLPVEIRLGHGPNATSKEDFVLVFSGKISEYEYEEGLLSLTIDDRTKNLDQKIPRTGAGVFDTGTVRRSWDGFELTEMLKDILENQTGILSRYIDSSSIDTVSTLLKAGDSNSPWITPKILTEPEEARGIVTDALQLIGAYLVSLEDGRLRLVQFPRSGPSLGTWGSDVLSSGSKQVKGLSKSLVNLCMVSFDRDGDGSNKGLVVSANTDSIEEWAPGAEQHISDREIKTSLLGNQRSYNGESIARKVGDRVVKTHKNGLVSIKEQTSIYQFALQVGDFVDITSPAFLKKFNLGSSSRQFMITEKRPNVVSGTIDWTLLESISHNRIPTAAFTTDVRSGVPNLIITFTDASTDTDGTIVTREWDFDYDGFNFTVDSTVTNPSHTYLASAIGIKTARLRVTDNNGGVDETETTIRVLGAPVAQIIFKGPAPNQPLFESLFSGSHGVTGDIVKLEWDLSYDGVTFNNEFEGDSTEVAIFTFDQVVALRVTDEDGLTNIDTHTVKGQAIANVHGVQLSSLLTTQWREIPNPIPLDLFGFTFGGGLYVAVGQTNITDAYILTSSDGETWTERANPQAKALNDVKWNGTLFAAVGGSAKNDSYIVTSPDGITWTERTSPLSKRLLGITWSGSLFVAVGGGITSDPYIVTSPDGITWTTRTNPGQGQRQDVAFGEGLFVSVGDSQGTDDTGVSTSPDGITWTTRTHPLPENLFGVTYGNGIFVAIGPAANTAFGPRAYMITSPDGITWTERENPKNAHLISVLWNGSVFMAAGGGGVGALSYIVASSDGFKWINREVNVPAGKVVNDIVWSGTRFMGVGSNDGTDAYIISSLSMIE